MNNDVYLAAINVPANMLFVPEYSTYVEIRAEVIHWENDEPKFVLEICRLNLLKCSNIKWDEFSPVVDQLVTEAFKIRRIEFAAAKKIING